MTTAARTPRRSPRRRIKRVPPPPFRAFGAPARGLLIGLGAVLAITVAVGVLVTVPTFATARYVVVDGNLSGGRASVLVLLAPGLDGRVPAGAEVELRTATLPEDLRAVVDEPVGRLTAADIATRFPLPAGAAATLPAESAVLAASVADGTTGLAAGAVDEATVQVGRRPLGEVFLGRGLEVSS